MKPIMDLVDELSDTLSSMSVNADLVIKNGEKQLMHDLDQLAELVENIRFAITGEWLR